ncbi:asparagine synthase (glutamine-hydrolyzing) [Aequorivita viscosa]|nr:asparagine synthase (glutamine-hydrolyzing) [Aequorivita viscosa]
MCGIVGIIGGAANEDALTKMLNTQRHRGPDFTGTYTKSKLCLGHNRLAIIDLSENANQPFISACGNYILVFNGEIYNYVELRGELKKSYHFKTTSDTEVLLAAFIIWGKECLNKFNGMFSFAIWNKEQKKLFAARDRFGVKPFYYTKNQESFFFASEIKTLFAADVSKQPNNKVWATYFAFGSYGMPSETFWKDIFQLPGGNYLEFKEDKLTIEKYYMFEEAVKKQPILNFAEAKEYYLELLKDSINLRFRADVPVGFNISGGLDSSLLLALVNQNYKGKNINAYTFYTGHQDYDELQWAETLISTTENPLSKVKLDAEEVIDLTPHFALFQDEPFGGIPTIAYGKIFREASKQGVKVLLDGQGMDEQWAGYDYYFNESDATIQGVMDSPFRKNVLKKEFLKLAEKPSYPKPFSDKLLNLQYRDLFFTKIPRALRFNDRISMAATTELREPFLDYRLVEFAFAQPLEYKFHNGIQKYLLRELVSNFLPDTITFSPKRTMQTPQREWLADELQPWVEEILNNIQDHPWFNSDELEEEIKAYFHGRNDSSFHIWQWISFALLKNPEF